MDVSSDSRFAHIINDPRFKRIPKAERKVKIDKRFQSMFHDKQFKLKYVSDKRGRPANQTSSEDLRKYYDISSGESSSDSSNDECSRKEKHGKASTSKLVGTPQLGSGTQERQLQTDDSLTEKMKSKLRDMKVDYSRGEAALLSNSSSDDDDSESGSSGDEVDHDWGELDRDAERTEDSTSRLAVCHMDWDRIHAADLMILFNSFLPSGGLIRSVTIYPSEFGLARMKEEEEKGPSELLESGDNTFDEGRHLDDEEEETEEGNQYHMEKLRQYQLKRLKYFYAVVVCDSPATANKLYAECDGMEYESSATRLDLRFIPDGTAFDQDPHEVCDCLPELSKYQPRQFTTTALQQVKVELTWDETCPDRQELTHKLRSGQIDGINNSELQAFIASSSGDSDRSGDEDIPNESNSDKVNGDSISIYQSLIQNVNEEERNKDSGEVEMEFSWDIGAQKLVDKKSAEGGEDTNPFDKYIQKRREKAREKRKAKANQEATKDADNPYSDDDIPAGIDMNDPYFQEELTSMKDKKNKKKSKKDQVKPLDEEETKRVAELELLLMSKAEDKNHFKLKSIQEREDEDKKKRKRKKGKGRLEVQATEKEVDGFKVDVKDDRFSALFSSHLFNIDPTDPHYHKTLGMETLRVEKLQRRNDQDIADAKPRKKQRKVATVNRGSELSTLVESVKTKTQSIMEGRK